MKTTAVNTGKSTTPSFSIIRGLLMGRSPMQELVDAAWLFAYTALWNHCIFSGAEKETVKQLICAELSTMANTSKAFIQFCERIILARNETVLFPENKDVLPSYWFSKYSTNGYVTAARRLESISMIRHAVPGHKIEIKALAEAVLELSQEPTASNFLYWRSYFIERKEIQLLDLLTAFSANRQFKIQ